MYGKIETSRTWNIEIGIRYVNFIGILVFSLDVVDTA